MPKTELLYFVTQMRAGWVIHCENLLYGPFSQFREAMIRAVGEAESAASYGFRSAVLVENDIGDFGMEWASDQDAYIGLSTRRPLQIQSSANWLQ